MFLLDLHLQVYKSESPIQPHLVPSGSEVSQEMPIMRKKKLTEDRRNVHTGFILKKTNNDSKSLQR
jgi:hypothetical protein